MLFLPYTSSHKKPPRRKQIYRKTKELVLRLLRRGRRR